VACPPSTRLPLTPQRTAGIPVSAAPENTVLTGLNYLKGQAEVLALPDSAYPPWLWNVLKPRVYEDEGPGSEGERVRRREERRQRIRDSNFMKTQ
jgi:large subunit ribosomal protein L54